MNSPQRRSGAITHAFEVIKAAAFKTWWIVSRRSAPVAHNIEGYVLKKQLEEFFSSDQKKVLVIKGLWGCGKTYFWKGFSAQQRGTFKESHISYVSLFGVSTVKDLQTKVFHQAETLDDNKAKKILTDLQKTGTFLGSLPFLKDKIGLDKIVSGLEDLLLHDYLICFDDIERKSSSLEMQELLGLISVWKEHRNCRIVMVLNEEELEPTDKAALAKFREKVIDVEITYSPSVEENAGIMFGNHPFSSALTSVFSEFRINNLRIMQQTRWHVDHFLDALAGHNDAINRDFAVAIAQICCFYYDHTFKVDVKELPLLYEPSSDGAIKARREEQRLILQQHNYYFPKQFSFIIEYLLTGKFDPRGLEEAVRRLGDAAARAQIEMAREVAFPLYYGNFQATEEAVIIGITDFLNSHASSLPFPELKNAIALLKDLGSDIDPQQWIDSWICDNAKFMPFQDLEPFGGLAGNEQATASLAARKRELSSRYEIGKIVFDVVKNSGWNPEDMSFLAGETEDAYLHWLRTETNPKLIALVRDFVSLHKNSQDQDIRTAIERLNGALRRLAASSKLDEIRIRNLLGLEFPVETIEDTPQPASPGEDQ